MWGDVSQKMAIICSFQLQLRSEEHTSELQSLTNLVCRLLLEKKKKNTHKHTEGTLVVSLRLLIDLLPHMEPTLTLFHS